MISWKTAEHVKLYCGPSTNREFLQRKSEVRLLAPLHSAGRRGTDIYVSEGEERTDWEKVREVAGGLVGSQALNTASE